MAAEPRDIRDGPSPQPSEEERGLRKNGRGRWGAVWAITGPSRLRGRLVPGRGLARGLDYFLTYVAQALVFFGGVCAPDEHASVPLHPGVGPEALVVLFGDPDVKLTRFVAPAAQEVLEDEGLREAGTLGEEAPPGHPRRPDGPPAVRGSGGRPVGEPVRRPPEPPGYPLLTKRR